MIVVVDDAERENEGDLVFAAQKATSEHVNFAVKHGRGISARRCRRRSRIVWASS